MNSTRSSAVLWLLAVTAFAPLALTQDAVPTEILQRTRLIRVGNSTGTAFSVDYKGKIYLVTARHVAAGLPATKAVLQMWNANKWEDVRTVKTLLPPVAAVDIDVFETEETISQPFSIPMTTGSEGPTMGQQVWFLGYPFGDTALTSRRDNEMLPFIKKGTMSAISGSDDGGVVMYIDGFNNPGFSGGPIVIWEFNRRAYRILGVVQGYRSESAKVMVNGQPVDTNILVNSGILIGYGVKHVIDAIENDQKK